ncbi:hypothetical protein PU707_002787 [Cronobacter sakazakii]|uniref:hypothetical protein n=1 Tax=Cronobacter TaxID=413496 RepID=UPI000BEA0212|nr:MULTISPECIES: hypothetical protein [Cronobacter]EKK4083625.1 hypothetical protein [Cronobacter dublinensis]EKM6345102.1 hypothetical protein [Cronobacter sakazakii]EKM6354515.1 hypothetical protein [Cronobacter sakazakii]EKM6369784.1 hypothetical protein [Cronobacter sakazakii]EKM6377550.1 hypothetical protein [Cronobacter sakazakii]
MDEKELFRELKDSGHKFVWYLREPGISNPECNSPDLHFIIDLNGKELARRLNIQEMPEIGWRIDYWHARDFGGIPGGAVKIDLHQVLTRFLLGQTGSVLP